MTSEVRNEEVARSASPFVDTSELSIARPGPTVRASFESPFVNEYEEAEDGEALLPAPDALDEFLDEMHDETFEEGVHALVDEVSTLATGASEGEALEATMREYLAPLARDSVAMIDRAAEVAGEIDVASEGETTFEALASLELPERDRSPAFELFLKGLGKKLRKFASKAVNVAKKGVALASGSLILRPLLAKLKGLVRPLLERVVKFALDKVPAAYRPVVAQLAKKLGGKLASAASPGLAPAATPLAAPTERAPAAEPADQPTSDAAAAAALAEPAAPAVAAAQETFDAQMAELLFRDDRTESETFGEAEAPIAARDPLGELDRAREALVREISEAEDGEAVEPAVERFVPAVLFAVRTGVRLLGRTRVVNLLGGLIAKLIGPLVGSAGGPALGRVLADVGLRAVFQAEVDEATANEAAARTVAASVEETVRRVAALPDEVLDQPELMEAMVYEAFQGAVGATFPTRLVKPELRELDEGEAAWVHLPRRGRKLYKKLSHVRDVALSPSVLRRVGSYRGSTLASFVRDRLRMSPHRPVHARVHVYEAIPHTRLARIAAHEEVRGLGSAEPEAASLIHPLTREAAGLLLGAPDLGRELDEEVHGRAPYVGQRLYYLEFPDAPHRPIGKESHLHVTVDPAKGAVTVCAFLGEVVAQKIAVLLRKKAPPATVVAEIRGALAGQIEAFSRPGRHKLVKIRLGAGSSARSVAARVIGAAALRALRRRIARAALSWTWAHLARALGAAADDFVAKANLPDDGVRLCVRFHTDLDPVRKLLAGHASTASWPPKTAPTGTLTVTAGPKHD